MQWGNKKAKPQKLTCSEEREERGAVAVSQQCGHLEAPMVEKLLPVNTGPSRIILIYKPLTPQEEGCSGWRLQSQQPSHHQGRVPLLRVQGAPSVKQAQAVVATKAPKKAAKATKSKKAAPKNSAKPKAAVPRRPYCTSKGNFCRKIAKSTFKHRS